MSDEEITVKSVVVYAIVNEVNQFIHTTAQGDMVMQPVIRGAQMFKPAQAQKFIQMVEKDSPHKFYVQVVK